MLLTRDVKLKTGRSMNAPRSLTLIYSLARALVPHAESSHFALNGKSVEVEID